MHAIIDSLVQHGHASQFIRLTVRALRDLTIDELIIAGDFWDRGPRGDRVLDYLRHQPNVAITWGNHDVAWLGACLGHEALIAHVLRISTRYRRLSQLEEGYGIIMEPLEHLVRQVYSDDPADCFTPRGTGLRETIMMARMQKAAAIMQFKLEGQTIQRNPEWKLETVRGNLLQVPFNPFEVPHSMRDSTVSFPAKSPRLTPDSSKCHTPPRAARRAPESRGESGELDGKVDIKAQNAN